MNTLVFASIKVSPRKIAAQINDGKKMNIEIGVVQVVETVKAFTILKKKKLTALR